MEEYIKRNIEEKLYQSIKNFPVVMITGPRQVGKTTLLKNLMKQKEYQYVTLDNPIERNLAKTDPALFLKKYETPLIIDEIQYATELLPYIKIQVDNARQEGNKKANGMYLLTGSQMFRMMQGVSETLVGRVSILNLYGLTTSEIQQEKQEAFLPTFDYIKKRENNRKPSLEQVFERIYRGSFPELIKNKDIDTQEYYSSYLQTYLERDIRDVITLKDETKFLNFISCVAARTAQELVYEDIARDVEIDIKTAKEWLSILRSSGLVYLLQPYSNNNIKRIIKRPKIYFMDTGLSCFLAKYVDAKTLEISAYSGPIFETYVVTEIIKTYINSGKYPDLYMYYYRDSNQKEIDLLITQNGSLYPIEIKKSANPKSSATKHFQILEKIDLKKGEGGVICMVDHVIPISENYSLIPIQCI